MNPLRRSVLIGTPLTLAIVEWFHPIGNGQTMIDAVLGRADWWIILHLIQIPLFALIALAIWFLVSGLPGKAPIVAKASAVCFACLIIAYDSVQGISTGILIKAATLLPAESRAGYEQSVSTLFSDYIAGNLSAISVLVIVTWVVAILATITALALADAPMPAIILLAVTVVGPHNFPAGTLGMGFFLAAVLWLEFIWKRPVKVSDSDVQVEQGLARPFLKPVGDTESSIGKTPTSIR